MTNYYIVYLYFHYFLPLIRINLFLSFYFFLFNLLKLNSLFDSSFSESLIHIVLLLLFSFSFLSNEIFCLITFFDFKLILFSIILPPLFLSLSVFFLEFLADFFLFLLITLLPDWSSTLFSDDILWLYSYFSLLSILFVNSSSFIFCCNLSVLLLQSSFVLWLFS